MSSKTSGEVLIIRRPNGKTLENRRVSKQDECALHQPDCARKRMIFKTGETFSPESLAPDMERSGRKIELGRPAVGY